jgi:hypothetical protein
MMINQETHNRMKAKLQSGMTVLLLTCCVLIGCRRQDASGPLADIVASEKIREAFVAGSSGSAEEAAVSTGTGWATLKGKFVYEGDAPERAPYNVNKDMDACTIGGKAPLQEGLVVDPSSKGIANVAVFVRSVSRVHDSAAKGEESKVFDQKNCVFLTHVFPIVLGTTMQIKNSDQVGHNTNIVDNINQTIPVGETIAYKPQKEAAEPKGVTCSIHPWMSAYFLPRKNGYVAVTDKDGNFEIPNLPAGENLEFQVWHESAPSAGKLVLTTPEAKELKWSNKGRFKVKLAENEVKELSLTVPPAAFGR